MSKGQNEKKKKIHRTFAERLSMHKSVRWAKSKSPIKFNYSEKK